MEYFNSLTNILSNPFTKVVSDTVATFLCQCNLHVYLIFFCLLNGEATCTIKNISKYSLFEILCLHYTCTFKTILFFFFKLWLEFSWNFDVVQDKIILKFMGNCFTCYSYSESGRSQKMSWTFFLIFLMFFYSNHMKVT